MVILWCLMAYNFDYMLNSMKMSLPYKILHSGSTYSEPYNSYNFCDRSKLFAAFNSPVNCLLGTWYCDLKCALKSCQMKVLKRNQ